MRIGICGSQSVGKSTLVKHLLNNPFLKNYTFFTERSKELIKKGIPVNKESTSEGQDAFLLERIKELEKENMITDRTILDVYAFTKLSEHISNEKKEIFRAIKYILSKYYDIIFYIPIIEEIKMEDNGIRETDEQFRIDIDKVLKEEFDKLPFTKKHYINSITLSDRVAEIIEVIENMEGEFNDKN